MAKCGIEGYPDGAFLRFRDRVRVDAPGIGARANYPGECQGEQQILHGGNMALLSVARNYRDLIPVGPK